MFVFYHLVLLLCALYFIIAESCNEDVCGSIVSKCILTQSCMCEPKDLSCYKDCVMCMGRKYFEECCSCVDLCPKKPNNLKPSLSQKSHVEDFEGVPELFDVLVSSPADELEYSWNIFTFPINFQTVFASPNEKSDKIYEKSVKDDIEMMTINCTVVYFDNCVSWNKCRQSCRSTGASSYRWFHDGCCECVGSTCINYGVNESRCKYCPEEEDDDHEEWDDNDEDDLYEYEIFDGNIKDNAI